MKMQADSLITLSNWLLARPETAQWLKYMHLDEQNAPRAIMQMVRLPVQALSTYSGDALQQVIQEIMEGNRDALYGICDKFHIAHEEMLKWIKKWVDVPGSKINNVLDYYGKTGEFSFRLGKRTKARVTFVDQNPWLDFAKYRFRLQGVHYSVKSIEATPGMPRPNLNEKYGFISSLEMPLEVTNDWVEWFHEHLYPYGFVATCADLSKINIKENYPFKKVWPIPNIGFIWQLTTEA